MAQSIQHDRYPKFVADQVLTEKSLNQMFGYLEEQQRLTRSTLIGIGVMCGMEVRPATDGTSLTITQGVGLTSKGYLVPFPETTYTFYNDEFSAEQEILYNPFINQVTGKQKFPLYLLHNNGAAEVKKPITADFLEDKAVVIFVELLKIDNKNCDPDSCDDKGCTIEVTHRPLLVDLENLDELIYGGTDDTPFLHDPACVEWPEIKLSRYNVPSTYLLKSETVLKKFLDILNEDFLFDVEKVLRASYDSLGYYIEDEFPVNPFIGLKNKFSFLYNGSISVQQLLYTQYYYDFFSDLILAYEELRNLCNECLAICCPNEALFPRHLILGNAIPEPEEFRHHWISSPALSCKGCSGGKIKFLLKKIALLVQKLDIPKSIFSPDKEPINVKVTPSQYGNIPLSDKAIPYYYDVSNAPNELYDNWNYKKTRLKKGDTNLSYYAHKYNESSYVNDPLNYDIEPYNFFRIEGHIGKNWKSAISEINTIKNKKRLPIDVVALNGDILELVQSLYSNTNSLSEIITGQLGLAKELMCYFGNLESQYDVHAAELRCIILKVMAYFYNLPVSDNLPPAPSGKAPQSEMIKKAFPAYKTLANTYGALFDAYYAKVKNDPYITPNAFTAGIASATANSLGPVALMYYLEKIYEALPDGLIDLRITVINQRLYHAFLVAYIMQSASSDTNLPIVYRESLEAIIRICKSEVFKVLYTNFLINYVLFISNQSFGMYAFQNPGIQHKAGVTTGGTFILVYNDKREKSSVNLSAAAAESLTEINSVESIDTGDVLSVLDGSASDTINIKEGNSPESILTTEKNAYKESKIDLSDKVKKLTSVKGQNLKRIYDLTGNLKADGILDDQELTALVDQFPDGTVIADFFVPFMCKSACAPMNFIVVDEDDDPTDVKIRIDKLAFCEDEKTDYEIAVTPSGGELKINGEVIEDEYVFSPSSYPVSGGLSRDIQITYELEGVSKTITVKVHKKPSALFSVTKQGDHFVQLKNESQFAETYEWNFGDGNTSIEAEPDIYTYDPNISTATITLTASNGPCVSPSDPVTVVFETNKCAPINGLFDQFKLLDEIGTTDFKAQIEHYELLKSIFVDQVNDINILPPKEQFKKISEVITVTIIRNTLTASNNIIVTSEQERRLALILYKIMTELTMFYACCQAEDVDEANIKTKTTLDVIRKHIISWSPEQIKFKDDEKAILKDLLAAIKSELTNTENNTPEKDLYIDLLKQIIEVLNPLAE